MKLINATHLSTWAGSYTAKSDLQSMLRRLIVCSVNATEIRFPDGEGIWLPGYDGVLQSASQHTFVPLGKSVWEVGTENRPEAKAEKDFLKRTEAGADADAEFIFVTPKIWKGKSKWAEDKKRLNRWKNVRAYDAHDLIAWMEAKPAVQFWYLHIRGCFTALC